MTAAAPTWRLPDRRPDYFNRRCLIPSGKQASPHDSSYTRVRLTQAAHAQLLRGIREPAAAGIETAGLLLGEFERGLFKVRYAPVADKPDRRRAHSADLDLARCDELARSHKGAAEALGTWHIHPNERGVPWPSRADLMTWLSWLDHLGVDRHLGVIVNRDLLGGWSPPQATAFILTRSGGKTNVDTVSVELPPLHALNDDEPELMVAVKERSWSHAGAESSFARGYTCWSDHPDAVDFPSAFLPVRSLTAEQRRELDVAEQERPARAAERNRDDDDPYAPWNYRYKGAVPSKLPGGWVRRIRPLKIGQEVYWEKRTADGSVTTYYGDCPKAA